MPSEIEELKKLSPKERLQRLKELKKKQEEEIKKAQDMMKASEDELEEEEKKKRQIPIPQLKSVDVSNLFGKGTQEEQLFDTKKFKSRARKAKKEDALEETVAPEEGQALEARIQQERANLREQEAQSALYQADMTRQQQQYQTTLARDLAEGSATNLYGAVKSAYEESKDKGYVSSEKMALVDAASQAALSKMDAMVSGDYQASQRATDALVASARMAKAMKDKYKA